MLIGNILRRLFSAPPQSASARINPVSLLWGIFYKCTSLVPRRQLFSIRKQRSTKSIMQFCGTASDWGMRQRNSLHFSNLCIWTAESSSCLWRCVTRAHNKSEFQSFSVPIQPWIKKSSYNRLRILALTSHRQEAVWSRICRRCLATEWRPR